MHKICSKKCVYYIDIGPDLELELGITIFDRTNRGVKLTDEGREFLSYASKIYDTYNDIGKRYLEKTNQKNKLSISTQHYVFVVEAFSDFINEYDQDMYDFTLRETTWKKVLYDVANYYSELGFVYFNKINEFKMKKEIEFHNLVYTKLFKSTQFVILNSDNPLANKNSLKLSDLSKYMYVSFGEGKFNSHYFTEKVFQDYAHSKNIRVSDRSTMFYLINHNNAFTLCTNMINPELQGENLIAIPLDSSNEMEVGFVQRENDLHSELVNQFLQKITNKIENYNVH